MQSMRLDGEAMEMKPMNKIKVLELFAGSRSIGKEAEKLGMEVFSCDLEAFDKIDYVGNILEFDYSKIPFTPDVIWASPPCTAFSVASIGRNWRQENGVLIPKSEGADLGISILRKTLEVIAHFNPKVWFIENPRGAMRKMPELQNFKRHTVTYCQYGDTRMKPTDIWTNSETWTPKSACKNGDTCHESAPRGSRTGTQGLRNAYERSKLPADFCREVMESCCQ